MRHGVDAKLATGIKPTTGTGAAKSDGEYRTAGKRGQRSVDGKRRGFYHCPPARQSPRLHRRCKDGRRRQRQQLRADQVRRVLDVHPPGWAEHMEAFSGATSLASNGHSEYVWQRMTTCAA